MSIKKWGLIALGGLVLGGASAFLFQQSGARNPASETFPAPKLKLQPWAHSLSGKTHQAMDVKISVLGGVPDHDEQEIHLRAEVTLHRPMDQEVKFQWSLPPDASVVSGEIEDAWPQLKPGQTASTEIYLTGVSKQSVAKTVTLHVSSVSQGVSFGSSGSFATNSGEQMSAAQSVGVRSAHNEELGLKKNEIADKLKRVQQ